MPTRKVTNTLPKTVVEEDHRLQEIEEQGKVAGRKLCELRWHWTRDKSNPARVSYGQYGRDVERTYQVISVDARAHELLTSGHFQGTVTDARARVHMSAERAIASEAVAAVRHVSLETVRTKKNHRDEAREVERLSREASEANDTTLEEEAIRIARQRAKEEREEEYEEEYDEEENEEEEDDSPPPRRRRRVAPDVFVALTDLKRDLQKKYEPKLKGNYLADATDEQADLVGEVAAIMDRMLTNIRAQEKKRRLTKIHAVS